MLLRHAGDPFAALHDALVGVAVPWGALDPAALDPQLLARARDAWTWRVETEFRSIQVMTRFLSEVLASGDPLEVYAGAADAVQDEIRHTALCVGMAEALGATPRLPEPVAEDENPDFLSLPMPQRALGTAVAMLAVSETISVALIEDLRARCGHPTVRAVLDATLADEDTHQGYGWAYVGASLERFDQAGRDFAQEVVEATLGPHIAGVDQVLAAVPASARDLGAWPEPELADLGLLGDAREALVKRAVIAEVLVPRLASLGILPPSLGLRP